MKTFQRRLLVFSVATLSLALRACSPVIYAPAPRPRPVVIAAPPPPAPVIIEPVVPVWAPPYSYVTEVHYYYFPDYCVYYNVFDRQYIYYNGFAWAPVAMLPAIPLYQGFNPYSANIIVLNRNTRDPWTRHDYYRQQYPTGYLNTTYAPRTSLSSNIALRAYDENQSRPVFTNRSTNKEVPVKYEVHQSPRVAQQTRVQNNNQNSPRPTNPSYNSPMPARQLQSRTVQRASGERDQVQSPVVSLRGSSARSER